MKRLIDLTNQRFGRLVVLRRAGRNKSNGNVKWLCQCDCGNLCIKEGYNLRKGNTRSCGCLRKEVAREKIFRQPNTIAHIGNSDTLQAAWHPSKKDAVRSKNRSGVTGVSYDRHHDLWIARLYYHRAYVLNRSFHTKEEAVAARLAAEAQYLN